MFTGRRRLNCGLPVCRGLASGGGAPLFLAEIGYREIRGARPARRSRSLRHAVHASARIRELRRASVDLPVMPGSAGVHGRIRNGDEDGGREDRAGLEDLMRLAHVLVVILTLVLAGCGETETPDILGIVKAGTLRSYTNKNIGQAFDHAFPGGTWETFTSGMGLGEMYAVFRSATTVEALEAAGVPDLDRKKCIDGVQRPCRIPVSFEFTLARDLRSISLAQVIAGEPMKSGEELDALLAFVYR